VGIGWFVLFLFRRSPVGATDEAGHVAGIEIIQPRRSAMNSLRLPKTTLPKRLPRDLPGRFHPRIHVPLSIIPHGLLVKELRGLMPMLCVGVVDLVSTSRLESKNHSAIH
jgi:hypothetical protein